MKMTFRYFGKNSDSVALSQIAQIAGVTGVMGFLDYKAAGEVWEKAEIKVYINEINAAGLECEVIESVNVHEDIKFGGGRRDLYIENYIATIRNLAEAGVKTIVYNFMPVFDWLRTDLAAINPADGTNSLFFDINALSGLTPVDIVERTRRASGGFSLPGWEPERLSELKETLAKYERVTNDALLANYKYFLDAVLPACAETGTDLAVHPDDPPFSVFGLPRVAHSLEQLEKIIALNPAPQNRVCVCTGSLGAEPENDLPGIIRALGAQNRVACAHLRNIRFEGRRVFRESAHLSAAGSLDMFEIVKAVFEACPNISIRPDHGRMIWGERARPGYGLYDRALGASYLLGLYEAIEKGAKRLAAELQP